VVVGGGGGRGGGGGGEGGTPAVLFILAFKGSVSLSEERCSGCCCCWHVNCIFDFEGTFCFLLLCFCI
jgi:hypothetical protein